MAAASSGLSSLDPDATSVQILKHPAAVRASVCSVGSWSAVETLAYPVRGGRRLHFELAL
jgi:hypothetical protein